MISKSSKLCCAIAPVLILSSLQAQPSGATLAGTITGSTGSAVPNAMVSVKQKLSGQSNQTQTDSAGHYSVSNLAPGEYEVSITATGFNAKVATVTITAVQARMTLDQSLTPATADAGAPALGDLGFSPEQVKGNTQDQARLDRRTHMLAMHQRLGLITTAPLIATLITSSGAGGHASTSSGRKVHAALGSVTAGMYLITASYAIRAPRIAGTPTRGPIRLHKALAWIHGPGMILTPILGAIAYQQLSRGEKVHGIANLHSVAAWTTAVSYGMAIVSVSVKF